MTVDIISDDRELLLLQPEWDTLWSSVESPCYFQSFNYILACWREMFKSRGAFLRCIVIRQSGKVVLIWPLIVTKKAFMRLLKPLCAGTADYTQPLVKDGSEAAAICALAWSAARSQIRADILSLSHVREGCCLNDVLLRERALIVEKNISYVQRTGKRWTDWDAHYKTIGVGHNLRSERKMKRKLAELGTMEFQVLERSGKEAQSGEGAAMIGWCLQQKREWAERVNKRGEWLYSSEFRNLLVSLFAGESSSQRYITFVLKLDGAPIAVKLAACNEVKLEGILAAFDAKWGKYSPGSLLDEYLSRWVFERSLELDFGYGTEPYKKFWSNNNAVAVASYRLPGSLLGRLALEAWQWRCARRQRLADAKGEPGKAHGLSMQRQSDPE